MDSFRAVIARNEDGAVRTRVETAHHDSLPEGDVTVQIQYSTVNYKDALALCGNINKIMKSLPFIPGIDLAGTVVRSSSDEFTPGDEVLSTGWGLGEKHWGGLSGCARLNSGWLTRRGALSARHAMSLGTAGFTAMLCVDALEKHGIDPSSGEILVTGATGGVGSVALIILSRLGYRTVAVTGRPEQADSLMALGASRVMDRGEFERPSKMLEKELWAGAVDAVGGKTLSTVLSQVRYGGTVAACGLAGSHEIATTTMPFILRQVTLRGVDSVYVPAAVRPALWKRLNDLVPETILAPLVREVGLDDVFDVAQDMIAGRGGRVVVKMT